MSKYTSNPSNEVGTQLDSTNFKRVPMSSPVRKLEVPDIPGYKMYWFRSEPGRLARALKAGYEFVKPEEVDINNHDLAGNLNDPGVSDLGDRVSVAAQDGVGDNGQYLRLYLMKIKLDWWKQDQELYERERIDPVVHALGGGMIGAGESNESPGDVKNRYQKDKPALPEMFKKKSNPIRT